MLVQGDLWVPQKSRGMVLVQGDLWVPQQKRSSYGVSIYQWGGDLWVPQQRVYGVSPWRSVGTTKEEGYAWC